MVDVITKLMNNLPMWLEIAMSVLTAATVITAMTPTKVDNQILDAMSKGLNFLAGNVGKNKNADS